MNQIKGNLQEASAVAAFRVKLTLTSIDLMKPSSKHGKMKPDHSGNYQIQFDINSLPLAVQKQIITVGIILGDIFEYSGSVACIRDPREKSQVKGNKPLYLHIRGPSLKSLKLAVETVEKLVSEVVEPEKITPPLAKGPSMWKKFDVEYEIKDLPRATISHLVTKGIIQGEIFFASGAVVNTRGSPYLPVTSSKPLHKRQLYLFIRGPSAQSLDSAVEKIKKLKDEAKKLEERAEKKPPVPSTPQTNEQLSVPVPATTTTEPATFSDVISKLQQLIDGKSGVEESVPQMQTIAQPLVQQQPLVLPNMQQFMLPTQQSFPSLFQSLAATPQPPQEEPLSAIIQQLEQYIQTNTQNTS